MSRTDRQFVLLLAALLCVAAASGCAKTPLQIASGGVKLPADENSAEYIDRISSQLTVSEDDALRGILLLLDGRDKAESFEQRVRSLARRNIVASGWTFRGDRPITRGKLAYMVYQACRVPGGLMLTLTGPSRRYCLLELQYRGFFTRAAMHCDVSGMEFVAVITRADTYLETGEVPEVLSARQDE